MLVKGKVYEFADIVSLRARRHSAESPPDNPYMFIEASWDGGDLVAADAMCWRESARFVVNRWDDDDPLNKGYEIQPADSPDAQRHW